MLKTLVIWSLVSSDAVQAIIKESYKRQRQDDDLNQPLSVQPWGRDGDKRRFWLIEGQDDTHFRLYRESNPALKHTTWRSLAGTIDEVKEVAHSLEDENSLHSRRLRDGIMAAIPRFEASEDVCSALNVEIQVELSLIMFQKRKRRDYRLARKAQFTRPEPGFSLYEGRTRGKRMKYTFSDEEDGGLDSSSTRRSNRQSGVSTPAEPSGPTFTASGRQVRSRHGGPYGETQLSGHNDQLEQSQNGVTAGNGEDPTVLHGRPRRKAHVNGATRGRPRKNVNQYDSMDSMDEESDESSSGGEWNGAEDDEDDDHADDDDDDEEDDIDMSDDEIDNTGEDHRHQSLVVSLRYSKNHSSPLPGISDRERPPGRSEINHHPPSVTETDTGNESRLDVEKTQKLENPNSDQIAAYASGSHPNQQSHNTVIPIPLEAESIQEINHAPTALQQATLELTPNYEVSTGASPRKPDTAKAD